MTVTKTNSEDSTSSLDVTKDLPTEIDTSTSSTLESTQIKSKLSPNRCLVCFKLVRNLKGSKLVDYHELSAAFTGEEEGDFSRKYESTNFSSKLPKDLNGNFIRENFNLVKQSTPLPTTTTIKKSIKIGDKISSSLKSTHCQQLFNKNSLYLKKICVQCLRQVNMLDFHVKQAERLADSLAGKIKWSSKLIGSSNQCITRALSSGALKENGPEFQSNRCFTKRKVIDDSQHSSMNILTKLVKTEPSLIKPANASRYQQVTSRIPNSFNNNNTTRLVTNNNNNINKKSPARRSTNETNYKGLNSSHLSNNNNNQLARGNVNNFKSINNDDQSSGLHNGMVCHTATNIFNKKNLSPASSLNKNSIVNQHSQHEHKQKNELKIKPNWLKNESDMSESSCKSVQQQQEMGSRRKRKNVNPSRLIKENLSELTTTPNSLQMTEQSSPKKVQLQNGHSTLEKRHHSLDSLTKFNHSMPKAMKPNKNMQKLVKAKICQVKSEMSQVYNSSNEIMKSKKEAEFIKMINNKENDKCLYNSHMEQSISKANNNNQECDNEDAEFSHENIDVTDPVNAGYVINESETEDVASGEMICNDSYMIDSHRDDEDAQEDDHGNINNEMEGDETENEIEIDINEVEHDAGDEYDHETETEDHSSIENDENTFVHMNGGLLASKRHNLDMINGSTNPNDMKFHKKISNLKKSIFSGGMAGHGMLKQNMPEPRYMQSNKNGGSGGIRHIDQVRFALKVETQARNPKKFSVKNENLVRNSNGNFNLNGAVMNYDENSNYSKLNRVFTSPSQSESPSPSPSQMTDTSHLNNYLNTSSNSNNNTKHACEVCKKTFKTQNILRQHMRIHTGDKPFVCDICSKAFSQMASLKYHLATHSDARPYSCNVCSKTFKLKPPFKKHIKECQPKLEMIGFDKNQYQHSSSPSQMNSFNYYNQNQFNINSNGLELETNEDDE